MKRKKSMSDTPLTNAPSFIETQFPVAKISMESYKERKSGNGQTLTSLGKWWGRKPLILVRAAILSLLLPASDNPEKDREIFLRLLTMDAEGLRRRKSKAIPAERLIQELLLMPSSIRHSFIDSVSKADTPVLRKLNKQERADLQGIVFDRLSYLEKLEYCDRPEVLDGPSISAWQEINAHLGTTAQNLVELVQQLGQARFDRRPRIGDVFCGGGSIPFESARLGCDAFGSDLNPVATLLTWAGLNLIGGGEDMASELRQMQKAIYTAVDKQITEWAIEHNSLGWRADAYLYCVEAACPDCSWKIPLAPSWIVAEKNNVIAHLIPDEVGQRYDFEILQNVSHTELMQAKNGTVKNSRLQCPHCHSSTPIQVVRRNMRLWENDDFYPRDGDVFQERLYCVRWVEQLSENGKMIERRHFRAPSAEDMERESLVRNLVAERFSLWQSKGFLPSRKITSGYNTDQPVRERGWTYWHHLFTPRQLLAHGLLLEQASRFQDKKFRAAILLLVGSSCNWNSKLCIWNSNYQKGGGIGVSEQTFANQALNTQYNFGTRAGPLFLSTFLNEYPQVKITGDFMVQPQEASTVTAISDIWITDPPYADAVNYHELSEFFLAWYENQLLQLFPDWYADSKRALAIRGTDSVEFRRNMLSAYKNLSDHMPDNGLQLVMFTHQDSAVWADLSMILWAANLRVTAAWTIATETSSGLKAGNYVQGTVLLVLRKRIETEPVFLDEISHQVEAEVRRQLDSMLKLEDNSDPNFGDADYQLAAYAAALRVLTSQPIEEIDPKKEILHQRKLGEVGPVEGLIRRAVKIACDHLIPKGLDASLWKTLGAMERFYIKGLEVQSHGEYRSGVYQELARGFGATAYDTLLESTKANETRLKSASEFGKKMLGSFGASDDFADSLVRQCLFAVSLTVKNEETRDGLNYLRTELRDVYWSSREKITGILDYLAALRNAAGMELWMKDSDAAALLAGAVRNDHV
jgi:putative DNA methylase